MASRNKTRRLAGTALLVGVILILGLALGALPSAGLGITVPTVTIPTVPVKTPTVPVKVPTVPVKTPTVPVKTPTIPVKVPTVPVKTPTVPVKVPTVPVKTPTVPVKVKTPTVPVKTPTVPAKAPTVPAKNLSGPVKVPGVNGPAKVSLPSGKATPLPGKPTVPAKVPGVGSLSSGTSSRGSGGGAVSGPRAGTAPGSLGETPGTYGEAPGTYGGVPVESTPGSGVTADGRPIDARTRARIARQRALVATVTQLQGCLANLPDRERELLQLRTGVGAQRPIGLALPLGPQAAAARLHVNGRRIGALERQALGNLRRSAQTHMCGGMGTTVASVLAFIASGFGGEGGTGIGARGGVEAVRYNVPPPLQRVKSSEPSALGGLLGADIPPLVSDIALILLLLLAAGIAVSLVLADAAGKGPRHEAWRRRIINRTPWLR
jgi:hypothetical protein